MKTLLCAVAGLAISTTSLQAQSLENLSVSNQLVNAGYRVVAAGPNTRTWTGLTLRSNQLGGMEFASNAVVEIGGGLNRWSTERNEWTECAPELISGTLPAQPLQYRLGL